MREEYRVYVQATGIKKRCRKVENHTFKLGYFPLDISDFKLRNLANLEILAQMKRTDSAFVVANYVTIEEKGPGYFIEHWAPFDEKTRRLYKKLEVSRDTL